MSTRNVYVHKIVRIGNTASGNPRFRFYTDQGSINTRADSAFCNNLDPFDPSLVKNNVTLQMSNTTISGLIHSLELL